MSPKPRKSNLGAIKFSSESFRSKTPFKKSLKGANRFRKDWHIHGHTQRARHQKDVTETQRCPFPQTALSARSMMHTKIHCSSAEWVRGMELKLCYDHLCSRGGFLHQERAQTRWEQSHTKREKKKKKKNAIKRKTVQRKTGTKSKKERAK